MPLRHSLLLSFALFSSAAPLAAQAVAAQAPAVQPAAAPATRGTGQPWQIVPQPQSSLVYARDGSLIGEMGRESRTSVPIRTLPKYVGQAFVAVEDQRFYQHDGVDLIGVAGAIKGKLLDGITGGGGGGAPPTKHQPRATPPPDAVGRRARRRRRTRRETQGGAEMQRHNRKERPKEVNINQIIFGCGWWGVFRRDLV